MNISYGLTVCNEAEELKNLIEYLLPKIQKTDEIVVVYDQNRVTDDVHSVLASYSEVKAYPFDFKQNLREELNFERKRMLVRAGIIK